MKKSILLSSIILLCTQTAFKTAENDKGCSILRKGTFVYGDSQDEIQVVIKGAKHTEYHNNKKYIIESKLDWVNDCEYNMTMVKITIPNFPYKVGDMMNVKIDSVRGNEIFYISTVYGQSWEGKLLKIK